VDPFGAVTVSAVAALLLIGAITLVGGGVYLIWRFGRTSTPLPPWKDRNPVRRENAVQQLTDQAILARVATTDSVGRVRRAALYGLTSQQLLAKIATTDSDAFVRFDAAERLTDQALAQASFAEITTHTDVGFLRMMAAERLTDQALAQAAFAEIAKTDTERDFGRINAARKLTDTALAQAIFAEIAKDRRQSWDVVCEALRQLRDQTTLAEIATTHDDARVRETAADRFIDETMPLHTVKTPKDAEARAAATAKLKREYSLKRHALDQRLLARDAQAEKLPHFVRMNAVKQLSDPAALLDVAMHAMDEDVRMNAVKQLSDPAALLDVALHTSDSAVAEAVVMNPNTPQAALAEVAKSGVGEYWYERTDGDYTYPAECREGTGWRAASRLTDETLLADVAKNARDTTVRQLAAARLDKGHFTRKASE
jgi:hypothetical protein